MKMIFLDVRLKLGNVIMAKRRKVAIIGEFTEEKVISSGLAICREIAKDQLKPKFGLDPKRFEQELYFEAFESREPDIDPIIRSSNAP